MNILLINHYAGSPVHGMEYRPFYLAREWVRAGHQVTILAASFSHVRGVNPDMQHNWQEEEIEGVRYVWVETPAYNGNGASRALNIFAFMGQLLTLPAKQLGNPEVIIGSSTYPLDVFAARQLARKSNAKVIYEVHDLWPLSLIELGGLFPGHPFVQLMQWGENYAYQNADLVVSMLPNAKDHMLAHGMSEKKFFHIPNGIDPDEWVKESNTLQNEHGEAIKQARAKGSFLVGYAGAHGIANALDSYIKAGQLLREVNVTLFLVGQGPEKSRLQKLAQDLGANNVIFLPTIPRGAVPAFLSAMDALYIGLQREPLFRFGVSPNKLMDYMMAGKPVIYAVEAGNDPVLESQCGLSIVPEDPQALCEGIKRLRNLPVEDRQLMGRRGYNYVTRKHSYKHLAKQFIEIIQYFS